MTEKTKSLILAFLVILDMFLCTIRTCFYSAILMSLPVPLYIFGIDSKNIFLAKLALVLFILCLAFFGMTVPVNLDKKIKKIVEEVYG